MQKFIDKIKEQNVQGNNSPNKLLPTKRIQFNNILEKKKIEEDKAEHAKLLKVVKDYYRTNLKRRAFSAITNDYYKMQSLLCVLKLSDLRRRRKLVFLSFLKHKCSSKLSKCVAQSIARFIDAKQRRMAKFRFFQIIKNKFLATEGAYLKIKKKRIDEIMTSTFYKWLNLTAKKVENKFEKARRYHMLRKKQRIFYLWKRRINDDKFFKKVDKIFLKLETIVSSWTKS
ncbi:conserved Plasmodium protein, unknown function [Plasmodium knowlesi strain H]|uniref:Sfi1 spindle body domain-containing protein n=3 Tax=Plasmodium knowlesi TaxID=5850 RepID=A0A5K1VDF4_PLAKH|nr:conserved Plasmodium protein, unknown function [Plasmodium knowlesi strain H]OTN65672.1 Uncharacterized protein PKNOH_S110109300 [Plasmodium knowlesi]CAA9989710.1 conserved Plasmodium protein, unknown function [Plasmodium knowlesi strain H]SBO22864.1 conserved Plasmodium protein, unknown function [Plasmodium knowlesi strain H]SBO23037.1 conserved Plasmodium protein, unknown function [Plasmodium knowlesi strain H]VVS79184.1 conserved Plasmodium protein, unknown function [Plasmodium knowlesi |eukprot:XP_002260433.1 hypothetical protein, conserved in Plasmodium species [Plasmodium knowlesi strain H]